MLAFGKSLCAAPPVNQQVQLPDIRLVAACCCLPSYGRFQNNARPQQIACRYLGWKRGRMQRQCAGWGTDKGALSDMAPDQPLALQARKSCAQSLPAAADVLRQCALGRQAVTDLQVLKQAKKRRTDISLMHHDAPLPKGDSLDF